jgi:hypothetical protein
MNFFDPHHVEIGIGATNKLSLRVSVATLTRVLFEHPANHQLMLALERTATWRAGDSNHVITIKAKPFGGGVRLQEPAVLRASIGEFHFDSQRSHHELDFRIFIFPQDWEIVKEFCLQHFLDDDGVLETSPERELLEEFEDALKITVTPEDFQSKPMGVVVEDVPNKTDNVRATGSLTVRIYKLFEVRITSPMLTHTILQNSETYSDTDLQDLAWKDKQAGGKGRANAVLALPYERVKAVFLGLPPEKRGEPIQVMGHQLDGNVLAVLEGVETPKYQRIAVKGDGDRLTQNDQTT